MPRWTALPLHGLARHRWPAPEVLAYLVSRRRPDLISTMETLTSETSPLRIAAVRPGDGQGRIGITLCPGKTDPDGWSGPWARDLDVDLDVVRDWGATAVVSLVEEKEIDYLQVGGLGEAVQDRHMEWWHLPTPDGMPPQPGFEEKWTEAGEAIRDRLRLGFDVLLHCKGGLGRAGTIAARLLVELGALPEDAIRRVRTARPGAIAHWHQEAYVKRCTLREPAVPGRTADDIRDRALGAFLGLAVGDAVGTTLEFCPRDMKPRLKDMVGGGPFGLPPGGWTDDTSMASGPGRQPGHLRNSRLPRPDGPLRQMVAGGRVLAYGQLLRYRRDDTRGAGAISRRTGDPMAGSTDPWSAGNGSLMRLAPVALRFWTDRARLGRAAAQQSRTTHGAQEAVDACRGFADMLADAISGKARPDVLAPRAFEGAPRISEILGGSWRRRARDGDPVKRLRRPHAGGSDLVGGAHRQLPQCRPARGQPGR